MTMNARWRAEGDIVVSRGAPITGARADSHVKS